MKKNWLVLQCHRELVAGGQYRAAYTPYFALPARKVPITTTFATAHRRHDCRPVVAAAAAAVMATAGKAGNPYARPGGTKRKRNFQGNVAVDQPVCDLQNKQCHWSCNAPGCLRLGHHQCTPIPKNGLTKRAVHYKAYGGHSLASQYSSRAPPIVQVCEHGYDVTRPKKPKKQGAVGQQSQPRTRKAPGTPANQQKKNQAKPQTRLKSEVLGVCTAKGKYGGPTCSVTKVHAWTERALAIPDSPEFTTKVGDLICCTCRERLSRKIKRFNIDQASTEAVCKAPTEKSNREIWLEFGESAAARDFNTDIEKNFPVFEIPAALRLPWERTLRKN